MSQAQFFNQLLFAVFGLLLAGLYASTYRVGVGTESTPTRRYWLLSVGARAGAFFFWSVTPFWGVPSAMLANGLFIFSAGCLVLLFRSWRINVNRQWLRWVTAFSLVFVVGMEALRQATPHFEYRVILLGFASLSLSSWELIELYKKIKLRADRSLQLIALIVAIQMLLSACSVITSILFADRSIIFVTDNGTKSIAFIWLTLTAHLMIYLSIGGYIYQRAMAREVAAIKEKNDVRALLEERERLLSSLIHSNRVATTGALTASVAHEISQPLTASTLQVGLLRRMLEERIGDHGALDELLNSLHGNINHATGVVDKLRKMFRRLPVQMDDGEPVALVSRTLQLMRSRIADAQVTLVWAPASTVRVPMSELEIQQVLINLINNAIDSLIASRQADRRIVIELHHHARSVSISVADNGAGVDTQLADSLFELARSNKSEGMGIGLWISKYIVEDRHRGRLYIDTDHTPGAKFVIELPASAAV